MPTPSSGAISFSDFRNYLGGNTKNSFSNYYKGGTVIPTLMGGADTIPTSGTISFSNLRNKPTDIVYPTFASAPIKGYQGSNGSSAFLTLPLDSYYPLKLRTTGANFNVGVSYDPGSTWVVRYVNTDQILVPFVYGTSKTAGYQSGSGSKSQYLTFTFNGSSSFVVTAYYASASSDNKSARSFIKTIQYT
tara:strand:+ start:406 stop:975 length:570 start_codon:yes stop_codon:yes gene_type:complete